MRRPVGIAVLSNFCRIGGGILAAIGIGLIVIGVFLIAKEPYFTYIALVGSIVGLVSVATGTIGWWIGRGLSELKNWARISAIVVSMLSLVEALLLVQMLVGFFALAWLLVIPWLGLVGLITWYLLSDEVDAAFQGQPAAAKRADMGRPAGVTIIAIVCFLVAARCLLILGIDLSLASIRSRASAPAKLWTFLLLGALIVGALAALAGWGLWQRKQWAPLTTIGLAVMLAALPVYSMVGLRPHIDDARVLAIVLLRGVVFLSAYALTIAYLLTDRVRQSFKNAR